jgi:predicted Rdx family selenoprotein
MRTTTENRNVNFGGSFTIRVEGQQGLDTKALSDYINSESFKQKMTLVVQEEMKKQNTSLRK